MSMDVLECAKPAQLIASTAPQVQSYIAQLEQKMCELQHYARNFHKLEQERDDLQERLMELHSQNNDCKEQLRQLTEDNEKLEQKLCKLGEPSATTAPNGFPATHDDTDLSASLTNLDVDDAEEANNANSVLIKNIRHKKLEGNERQRIMAMARLMGVTLTPQCIRKVSYKTRKFYDRQNMKPDTDILIVEFKSNDTKIEILKHKEKLKATPHANDIEILDYVSEDVYNLYQYAKTLKTHGYAIVYWRNNSVYAKKTRSTNSHPILIKSTAQVELMKAKLLK